HTRQSTRASRRKAPAQSQAVNLRRRERRGLLLRGRQTAHLSLDARGPRLRSDLHDERRRLEREDDLQRRGPHHVFVLLSKRKARPLLVNISRRQAVPAKTRLLERLRLGRVSVVRHLHREPRRLRSETTDKYARLRCGN